VAELKSSYLITNPKFIELVILLQNFNQQNKRRQGSHIPPNLFMQLLMSSVHQMLSDLVLLPESEHVRRSLDKIYEWYNNRVVATLVHTQSTQPDDSRDVKVSETLFKDEGGCFNFKMNFNPLNEILGMKADTFERHKQSLKKEKAEESS